MFILIPARTAKLSIAKWPTVPTPAVKQEPLVVVEDLPSQDTQAEIGGVLESLIGNSTGGNAQPTGFPDLSGPEYAWSSEDQLELIWRGSEVPLESSLEKSGTAVYAYPSVQPNGPRARRN